MQGSFGSQRLLRRTYERGKFVSHKMSILSLREVNNETFGESLLRGRGMENREKEEFVFRAQIGRVMCTMLFVGFGMMLHKSGSS